MAHNYFIHGFYTDPIHPGLSYVDGVATLVEAVTTVEGYRALKALICRKFDLPVPPERFILVTLTPLGQTTSASAEREALAQRLREAQIGACTCLTKTPDPSFHEPNCLYRLLVDAATYLDEQG